MSFLLLKGSALARSAYGDASLRPMLDLDIWVPDAQMPRARRSMEQLGFRELNWSAIGAGEAGRRQTAGHDLAPLGHVAFGVRANNGCAGRAGTGDDRSRV